MNKKREIRCNPSELRIFDGDDKPRIEGYAAVFNSRSVDMGFFEIVRPGAFKRSLESGADVVANLQHEGGLLVLGRTKSSTLRLSEDTYGLKVEIDPPDTQAGRDVIELLNRGDLDSMSFAFQTIEDSWHIEDGNHIRELIDVELIDVAVVTNPGYPQTSVNVRSLDDIAEEGRKRLMSETNSASMKRRRLELM